MALKNWIAESRVALEQDLNGSEWKWRFSPALYVLRRQLIPVLQEYLRGRVLDVGCGRMPLRSYLENNVLSYDGLDIERRSAETKYLGDAHDMMQIDSSSYDTVVSFSVLEHLPRPWEALREMHRVCRPGGTVVIEVPHLSRYHELPHDYYRFTSYGLRSLAEAVGLKVISVQPMGGLFGFLGHQVSTLIVCSVWRVPVLNWIVLALNYVLVVGLSILLDRLLNTAKLMPLSVVGVFRKPE